MKSLIKTLLNKYLVEHTLDEAVPMGHFNDRVIERVLNIKEITLGHGYYLPNLQKEIQDKWIIEQIKNKVSEKIKEVINKEYPINNGVCVLVPLGPILVKPPKGQSVDILIAALGYIGKDYYISIYDNRMPTIVLSDPNIGNNRSPEAQLNAHMYNNIKNNWPVNKEESFIDTSFNTPIIIKMVELRNTIVKT